MFTLFGSLRVKILVEMLVKLTKGFFFIIIVQAAFVSVDLRVEHREKSWV